VKTLAILLSIALLCGCQTTNMRNGPPYYKVVTTDLNGRLISSWIAKGRVHRKEGGYKFTAVERQIENPPAVYRYPLGWRVTIAAPKTVIYPVTKPLWLQSIKPLDVADAAEDGVQAAPPVRLGPPRQPAADPAR
jgi:hypothetical protein